MISIVCPTMHTAKSARTLKVFLDCLIDNTATEYELLLSCHDAKDAYVSMNTLARQARCPYLVFLNDDLYVAPRWDLAFLEAAGPSKLLIGSLIESGNVPVNQANLERDYGRTPENYHRAQFENAVRALPAEPRAKGNLIWTFPWFIARQAFFDLGGFALEHIGQPQGHMLDNLFWSKWRAAGNVVERAPAWCYHLMKWTSTDFAFGQKIGGHA